MEALAMIITARTEIFFLVNIKRSFDQYVKKFFNFSRYVQYFKFFFSAEIRFYVHLKKKSWNSNCARIFYF